MRSGTEERERTLGRNRCEPRIQVLLHSGATSDEPARGEMIRRYLQCPYSMLHNPFPIILLIMISQSKNLSLAIIPRILHRVFRFPIPYDSSFRPAAPSLDGIHSCGTGFSSI